MRSFWVLPISTALLATGLAGLSTSTAAAAEWFWDDNPQIADGIAAWGTETESCLNRDISVTTVNSQAPLDGSATRVPVKIRAASGATYMLARGYLEVRAVGSTTLLNRIDFNDLPPYVLGRAGTVQVVPVPTGPGLYEITGSVYVGFDGTNGVETDTTCSPSLQVEVRKIPATVQLEVGRSGWDTLFTGKVLADTLRSGPVGAPAEVLIEKYWDESLPYAWLPVGTAVADGTGAFQLLGPEYLAGGRFRARSMGTARLDPSPDSPDVVLPRDPRPAPPGIDPQPANASAVVRVFTARGPTGLQTTEYVVTATPGGRTCTVNVPLYTTPKDWETCIVTGLTNGTTYTFTGVAKNSAGSSKPYQAAFPVTPYTSPSAPTGLQVSIKPPTSQSDLATVTFSWDASDDGGLPVTGYTLTVAPAPAGGFTRGALQYTMPMAAGQTYTASVRAIGSMGTVSGESVPLTFTTPSYVGPPTYWGPSTAEPADTQPAPVLKVKRVSGGNKLKVDLDPNLPGTKSWTFTVQRLAADGTTWNKWRTFKTTTKKEVKTVNPKKGTYRIVVGEQRGYRSATSSSITLNR